MLKKVFFIILIGAAAGFIAGCDGGSGSSYPFYLTEVSTVGSIGGLSVDYIELYNPTDEDIDLTGYYIGDRADEDHQHVIGSTVSLNEWDTGTVYVSDETTIYGDGVEGSWVSDSTEDGGDAAVIPAGGYLIILFSNDFKEDDDVSKTLLPASWNEFDEDEGGDDTIYVTLEETHAVDTDFAGSKYLTIPEGLKESSDKDGVYIYKPDGTKAAAFFTYEEDEQNADAGYVFLYNGSSWTQGNASPGAANE